MLSTAEKRELRSIIRAMAEAGASRMVDEHYEKGYALDRISQLRSIADRITESVLVENSIYSGKCKDSQDVADKRKYLLNSYFELVIDITKTINLEREILLDKGLLR